MDPVNVYPYKPGADEASCSTPLARMLKRRAAKASIERRMSADNAFARTRSILPTGTRPARQAHRMLDDMLDHLAAHPRAAGVAADAARRARRVSRAPCRASRSPWKRSMPNSCRRSCLMAAAIPIPRFMGWVQGGGTVPGMLAEMLAAGLNANLGGRDHSAIEVERQLVHWVREMFGFPNSASGIFVTGTSIANFMAVLVARTRALGTECAPDGSWQGGSALARLYLGRGAWLRARGPSTCRAGRGCAARRSSTDAHSAHGHR